MKTPRKPVDMSSVTTYPLQERINKVSVHDFATLSESETDLSPFLASLPKILKAPDFLSLVDDIVAAYRNKKPVIVMMGGHVIKCGLSLLLIDLAKRGVITSFAFNGASSIHDFEIALIGETSEDVSAYLETGKFGMWEETGQLMNTAIQRAAATNIGMGEALGKQLIEMDAPYNTYSLLAAGVQNDVPITVHVAIGTDIIHQHPSASGAAIGAASFTDFQLLTALMKDLEGRRCRLEFGVCRDSTGGVPESVDHRTEFRAYRILFHRRQFRHAPAIPSCRKRRQTPDGDGGQRLHLHRTP